MRPSILLVHGGWHVPQSYAKLVSALESLGFEVHVPRLPSIDNVRPPKGDLSDDTKTIRSFAEKLLNDGKIVIALLHSYGGQVGSNALYGLGLKARSAQGHPGGISHLIYLAGYVLLEGTSMIGKIREFGHESFIPINFDIAEDNSCIHRFPKAVVVNPQPGEVDNKELDDYIGTFERWNIQCIHQGAEHGAWREIPVSYVYTTHDMVVAAPYQKHFVETMEKEGCEVQTFELATGHCPNLTAINGVVDVVKKVFGDQE
ncbi:alpha/beta-hydrolase [Nemania sp. FL0031]|nr:alpha/beta-hydrolase [Nemania sp. FL0031]